MPRTLIALLLAGWLGSAMAAERLYLNLIVNGVAQGDVDALYDQDGYWLAEQALKRSGISTPEGMSQEQDGIRYFRADALDGIRSRLQADELTLYLDAGADEFGVHQIALTTQREPRWPSAAPWSAYLSYDAAVLHQSGADGFDYQFLPTLNAAGNGWAFRSEHSYFSGSSASSWARLRTTLDYVRPEVMQRISAGDLSPRQGALGFTQALAGIGIASAFELQPDFEAQPTFQSQAAVTQPSTAEIYLNGQRIKTIDLQPGIYEFSDLRYFSGLQNVDIVLRDRYGGTQRYAIPYYFDDTLLRAGLSDYSHNLGLGRVNGSFDRYDGLAYSLYQRYGVTDWLTVGAQASGYAGDHSYGALFSLRLGWYGVLSGVGSWARHRDQPDGDAQQLNYRYNHERFSIYANLQRQSPYYWKRSSLLPESTPLRWSANLGASIGAVGPGTLSLEYGRQEGVSAQGNADRYLLGYTFSPWPNTSLSAQARLVDGNTRSWSGFLNLSVYFADGHSLYGGAQYQNDQTLLSSTLSKSSPAGEGWGYSLSAQQQADSTDYMAWLERKLAFGQASFSGNRSVGRQGDYSNWRLGWQGALAYADGAVRLTRPIDDAFAVVRLDGLADVGIEQNGSLIGHTDEEGVLFLPDVPSFSYQQIGVVQNDLPIEYGIDRLQKTLLSGERDGRRIGFATQRIHGVSGQILRADGSPLGSRRLQLAGTALEVATAMDGRFYSEQLPAGSGLLQAEDCRVALQIPANGAVSTELGTLYCQEEQ
ncbi:fimbria/pilus outer membrane usher protein [Chitinilyticum piscinae]|uniref:Fimbrial biogenesis outer membrane usher protein n=1 Tax=Chitinilyticum piscinae TaxID=2866724 RepID=A0A8J7FPG4_9NEIS|nr:fimbria/pilus outer membrane usher protein [Chitinilyticum piscinae]MBE9608166.1 fimbrial biogenesis outer membrane usher protein [Chitinilyticum piscinae]